MKNIIPIILLLFILQGCNNEKKENNAGNTIKSVVDDDELYARNVNKGLLADTVKKSVKRFTTATVNGNEISIGYYSPGVKDRIIWGGIVPYGQIWVTGAHSATILSFTKDLWIGNMKLTAGSYAIFTVPGKESWVIILNKNFRQHLTDEYNQKEDVLRIDIKAIQNINTVRRLTYDIKPLAEGMGSIIFSWEKIRLDISFNVKQDATSSKQVALPDKSILKTIPLELKKDPVCLMPISAGITDTTLYRNKCYGFCSSECKRLFNEDPDKYLKAQQK
jgi:YHS domain-containing protein